MKQQLKLIYFPPSRLTSYKQQVLVAIGLALGCATSAYAQNNQWTVTYDDGTLVPFQSYLSTYDIQYNVVGGDNLPWDSYTTTITPMYPTNDPHDSSTGVPYGPTGGYPFFASADNRYGDYVPVNGSLLSSSKGDLKTHWKYSGTKPIDHIDLLVTTWGNASAEINFARTSANPDDLSSYATSTLSDSLGNSGSVTCDGSDPQMLFNPGDYVTSSGPTTITKLVRVPIKGDSGELDLTVNDLAFAVNDAPYSEFSDTGVNVEGLYNATAVIDNREVNVTSSLGTTHHKDPATGLPADDKPDDANATHANTVVPTAPLQITYTANLIGSWSPEEDNLWHLTLAIPFGQNGNPNTYNNGDTYIGQYGQTTKDDNNNDVVSGLPTKGQQEHAFVSVTDFNDGANCSGNYYVTFHAPGENLIPDPNAQPIPSPLFTDCDFEPNPAGASTSVASVQYTAWPVGVDALIQAGQAAELLKEGGEVLEVKLDPRWTFLGVALGIAGDTIEKEAVKTPVSVDDVFKNGCPVSMGGSAYPTATYSDPPLDTTKTVAQQKGNYHMTALRYFQRFKTFFYLYDSYGDDGFDGICGTNVQKLDPDNPTEDYVGDFVGNGTNPL